MSDNLSAEDRMMLEGLYWWDTLLVGYSDLVQMPDRA
jgi:hypothetical protein